MTNQKQIEYYDEKFKYWITTIDDFEDTPYTCAVIDETCRLVKLIEAHPELGRKNMFPARNFWNRQKRKKAIHSIHSLAWTPDTDC